jgi:large subunit ribosomal protein L25
MDIVKLPARVREDMSKTGLKALRRTGFVPANISGHGVSESLEVKLHDLVEMVRSGGGSHALIDLQVTGNKKASGAAIIKTIQKDPITRRVLHVDFQHVSMTEKITTSVPVEIIGEPQGKKSGGTLEQVLVEIPIRVLPGDLPPKIEIDATDWEIGHVARAGELEMPEGVELATDPEDVVATLRPPHIHVEAPVVEEVPEVETTPGEAPEVESAGEEA